MKTLIIIPTYNEKENISNLLKAIEKLDRPSLEILVVDDSSPDKTGEIVLALAKTSKLKVHLLSRQTKQGLGAAYVAGFSWALERNYDYIISMDADFSHDPKDLLQLIDADPEVDVVIGSRYIPGGKIVGWDAKRYLNSHVANWVTRIGLGLAPHDVTAGFKRYSRKFLKALDLKKIISSGYSFQVEMIFEAHNKGFKITEVPITFVDRRVGQSKISGELGKSARIVWKLFLKRRGVRQFIKFGIVGFINALLDWLVFYILKIPLGGYGQIGKQLAKAGSFIISGSSSYIMNRRWTFKSSDPKLVRQASKFFLVASIGMIINNFVFYLITSPSQLDLKDYMGLITASFVAMFWNFTINKLWTFK